jgi:hypothetical protein
MYCGQRLPGGGDPGDAATLDEDRAQRARDLLDGLTPAARAMMPAEVLAKLEQDAGRGPAAPEPSSSPPASPALPPPPTPPPAAPPPSRPSGPRLVFSARRLPGRRRDAPPVPGALDDLPSGAIGELSEPPVAPILDLPSHSIADLPPANEAEGSGGFEATLLEALGRGGGPFGPRKRGWRLVLLPSPKHRAGLPWLKSRLARTLGMDLYSATQHLQKLAPTCLAVGDVREELDADLERLREAGLEVAILQRREWARGRLQRLVSGILDLDEDPLLFTLQDGEPVAVRRRSIHSALLAEIAPVRETVQVEKGRFGIPKKPDTPSLEDRFSPYIAVDLLLDDDPRPLRLRSSELDFAELLGDQRQIAATLNMRQLVARLSPSGRVVPINEGFRRVHVLPGPVEREEAGGMKPGTVSRRAVDFTEFSLLCALSLHPL